MEQVLNNNSVRRIVAELKSLGIAGEVRALSESARTAAEAAAALGVVQGQIASSIVFRLSDGSPLLVVTSGAHRVDTNRSEEHTSASHSQQSRMPSSA